MNAALQEQIKKGKGEVHCGNAMLLPLRVAAFVDITSLTDTALGILYSGLRHTVTVDK